MSLLKSAAAFARSPKGRAAINQAKARLDTPENRQRVTEAVSRVRASRTGARRSAPPEGPTGA